MTDSASVHRAPLLGAAAASLLFALAACDSPEPAPDRAKPAPAHSSVAAPAAPAAPASGSAPARPSGAPTGAPSVAAAAAGGTCGAPAGAARVFVSSAAKTADGGADLVVSDTRVTCSPDGLDPVVEGAGGTGVRTLHLVAGAAVHLLSPDNRLAAATPADLTGLFAAHAASRSGTGALGWKGNVFTVRVDGSGRIDFLGQGPWSTLNTAPPK
ncbi:hypothetical protein AB0442_30040 [Kitasatospora sp. NPDC085895]|uniref:hypothetical protein n=1 Tax=Kitasatospora sp. NPDC085895 TaxID=3155057 RepID=UPI003450465F